MSEGIATFEDVEVGHREAFGRYEVTREEVIDFARRYDPQPFHLSDEAAAQTHFGRLAASGWHSCAMTMAMLVENMKARRTASLGSPGLDELRWLRPVYPGDTLRCESEVLDKRRSASRPGMGIVKTRLTVFNQDDVAVMSFVSNGLIATRDQAAAARPRLRARAGSPVSGGDRRRRDHRNGRRRPARGTPGPPGARRHN